MALHDELVAIGATATDLDSYVVGGDGFDVHIRRETRRGVTWVMMFVPIAHARDRDAVRCRRSSADLVVGSLVTSGGVLLLRCMVRIELADRVVLRSAIAALVSDATRFEAATRPVREIATYACFGQ